MNIQVTKPDVNLWLQEPGIDGMRKQIERCGRICYRSEAKGGDSAAKFVNAMRSSGHHAMLEHGTVYLTIPVQNIDDVEHPITHDKYTRARRIIDEERNINDYITTNYRVLVEHDWEDLLKYWSEPTEYHDRRVTAIFNTNIAISREFNRHRVNSMAESSTRYCNYSKDKYGNSISVIEPMWLRDRDAVIQMNCKMRPYNEYLEDAYLGNNSQWEKFDYWLFATETSNFCYLKLLELGCKPEEARDVLGLSTQTMLVHTAFVSDWRHFFRLRAEDQPTNHPHPMAKELAAKLKDEFIKINLI